MKTRTILLSMTASAWISAMQGQTMFEVLNTPSEHTFVATSFVSSGEGWLADDNATLWHTTDAAQSWTMIFSGKTITKLGFADALNGFAISETPAAYQTADGGVSWSALPLDEVLPALWIVNEKTGFISGDSVLFKTSDGGESWISIILPITSFNDLYFMDESVGVATTPDGSCRSVWRTTDGGLTWSNVFDEPRYFMYSVWFINEQTGFAAGCYEQPGLGKLPAINKTTDGGATWENIYRDDGIINRGEPLTDIRFENEMNGFAIGAECESVYTTDGGLTWTFARTSEATGLPMEPGLFRALGGNGTLFIVGEDGLVIKW